MASGNHGAVLRGIGRIFNQGSLTGLPEGQLVRQFAGGDEGAFEVLVTRHGPMVLGVCRRLLHEPRDVEDAFQATFLVLLRKAGGLRDAEALGPWLHGVAYRVAARIRSGSARRPAEESKGSRPEAVESACDLERSELRMLIDEEIRRLPEKYRRPVVLCYLEGRTHEEAARRLRCSTGSVRGRLDRAREKLRDRLTRRGLAPAAGLAVLVAGGESASAAVPGPLVAATVATLARAATATAVSGAASAPALQLADGVFRAMVVARLRFAAVLVVGILAMGMLSLTLALEHEGGRDAPSPQAGPSPRAAVDEPGGITATGRVLDQAGWPISGARVTRGSDRRGQQDVIQVVTTDADGRFVMRGIPFGSVILTVQARGHAPDLKWVNPGPEMSRVEFRLGPGHTIRGRIVDAHDKPIAGAPIASDQWRVHHSLGWSTRTDADGRFRFDDAPADAVQLDLGTLGFDSRRYWTTMPDAPEQTISMRRPIRVRGRVSDAETGRPITAFTLVPGYVWARPDSPDWQNDRAQDISGLSYDASLSTEISPRVIRIEAEGYLPSISRAMKDDEEEAVVHFALHRGPGISGVVRLPDGSPLAGADVALATPSRGARVHEGRFQREVGNRRIVRTSADGRFTLEPTEPPYTILVLHARGCAVLTVDAGGAVPPAALTIQPWSRIEGTLRIGRNPGGSQTVCLNRAGRGSWGDGIYWMSTARSDAEGHFTFEHVAPGGASLSRSVRIGKVYSTQGSTPYTLDVPPGATVRAVVGGTGRPVVGKVVLPAELAGRDDWLYSTCNLGLKPTGGGPDGAGIVFAVEPDGSFRIDDIEAGTYELHLVINKRPDDPSEGPLGTQTIATARREVVVPPMPGGRSDEPMDLGKVPITVVGKLEPPADPPKADRFPPRQEPFPEAREAKPAMRRP